MSKNNSNDVWDSIKIEPLTTTDISSMTSLTGGSIDTISISDSTFTYSDLISGLGSDTISIGPSTTTSTGIYTPNTGTSGHTFQWQQPYNTTIRNGGVVELHGENADILVNGRSLMNAISALEERLNILRPNPELESEWDQLRELGEQYRKLEAEIKEKCLVWKKLKDMPAPDLP